MRYSTLSITDFCTLLVDDTNWGNADLTVLKQIFYSVIDEFCKVSGVIPPRTLLIFPDYDSENPKCCKLGDICIIHLTARSNYWSQYVYQFAHEYCHYLIDGPMDGERALTMWFEESICELASIFFINRTAIRWNSFELKRGQISVVTANDCASIRLRKFVPCHQKYLQDILHKNPLIEGPLHQWLESNMPILSESLYHRDMYNQIATSLYETFNLHPDLWCLLPFLCRPKETEFKGFKDFILRIVRERIQGAVASYSFLVELLTGESPV